MKTETNPQLELARKFVQFTGKNIFLTGKAGTGKTTFLHELKKEIPKRMIVVAPTGVAAINAGGVTIHSFFQLPFGPIIPGFSKAGGNDNQKAHIRRFSKEKINIMKSLDLLVIDEISMVRADVLDGIDETLRRFRNHNTPFGGVQLLMIGDMQQLAPVVKDDEWEMLRKHYKSAFFFSSTALQKTHYVSIELKHVYRQSDQKFIKLLNHIRENELNNEIIEQLNKQYKPGFTYEEGYITLTTHNARAADINNSQLKKLKNPEMKFVAEVSGNFPEYNYPTNYELILKEGAQVMFVKNDPSPLKQYFNGKIGKITGFDEDTITVYCSDENKYIHVGAIEWNNYKYSMDNESKEIRETIEGTFKQLPLKLAWAITIHKSQGLTFEKAIIDAQAAFAFGQVYVALSRCKSLEGLVLSSRINPGSVKSSSTISRFNQYIEEHEPGEKELKLSKLEYQKELLTELFDFKSLDKLFFSFARILRENFNVLNSNAQKEFVPVQEDFREKILNIGERFQPAIKQYFNECSNIEGHKEAQQRIIKASSYFTEQLNHIIFKSLTSVNTDTDNKSIAKKIDETLEKMLNEANFKTGCMKACMHGFSLSDYVNKRSIASIEEKGLLKKRKQTGKEDLEPGKNELYNILRSWRMMKAEELDVEPYQIFHQKTLMLLCKHIPGNRKQLKAIYGFGKKRLDQFGDELLEVLNDYRVDQGMELIAPEEPEMKKQNLKSDTKKESLKLHNTGLDIAQIASIRKLAYSTVSGHLAFWVEEGEIPVQHFVSDDKIEKISKYYLEHTPASLTEMKDALGDEYTYSELRFVVASVKAKKS